MYKSEKRLNFRNRFYNKENTKKWFLMKDMKVVGTVLQYNTQAVTEIMIYGDSPILQLKSIDDRTPVKSSGYGYNREADCFRNFYREHGIDVSEDDLRLLESGRISEFFESRGITVIS